MNEKKEGKKERMKNRGSNVQNKKNHIHKRTGFYSFYSNPM